MKLIVVAALIGVCAGGALPGHVAPQYYYGGPGYYPHGRPSPGVERNAAILRSDSEVTSQGFQYVYDTENGIHGEAAGVEANGIQSQGAFSYTGDDGQQYAVKYTADANGFQAQGAHLPTPPPIPDAIVRSIEENARAEAAGVYNEGSYNVYNNQAAFANRHQYPYQYQSNRPYNTLGYHGYKY
uniref:Cuticle protein 2 n=1 Tax=Lonomia obliqua TaxID=304329 RepID=CU02_LONON|nr:RecName: Full=Cuticle protein 2; Flags: Precursor [Lonomia obliqua]ABU88848.1 cuticle protein 2 [Lonomia obliqua]